MFENMINNFKAHSCKLSESLNLETIKAQTSRLTENFDSLKEYTSKFSDNFLASIKSGTNLALNHNNASHNTTEKSYPHNKHELKCPVLVKHRKRWVTISPKHDCVDEEEDIVERFIRVIKSDEENLQRRNDREEIRRRLAMGSDAEEYYGGERLGRKPSLQARLQSGMNLQICFMNETVSDQESPSSDTDSCATSDKMAVPRSQTLPIKSVSAPTVARSSPSLLTLPLRRETEPTQPMTEADFFARQARLQAEARMALAQAKEMAHMQMEVERQRQKKSPITEMVRCSLEKVGIPFPEDRRRVSRQILTEMNVAQLQVIVNDLHTQIEMLNEGLVKFLMDRDDLHMEQDSMLVDIEDLTRYLGAKEHMLNQNNNLLGTTVKTNSTRLASIAKK